MLQSIEVETKKGKQIDFYLQCDFCRLRSRSSTEVGNVLYKARQDGWVTRYGTGNTVIKSQSSEEIEVSDFGKNGPAKWCCPQCVEKEQHLSTEEKLRRKLSGLSQEDLDRICQP